MRVLLPAGNWSLLAVVADSKGAVALSAIGTVQVSSPVGDPRCLRNGSMMHLERAGAIGDANQVLQLVDAMLMLMMNATSGTPWEQSENVPENEEEEACVKEREETLWTLFLEALARIVQEEVHQPRQALHPLPSSILHLLSSFLYPPSSILHSPSLSFRHPPQVPRETARQVSSAMIKLVGVVASATTATTASAWDTIYDLCLQIAGAVVQQVGSERRLNEEVIQVITLILLIP